MANAQFNDAGGLALFGGPFLFLLGGMLVAASIFDSTGGLREAAGGVAALLGGGAAFVWGRRRTRSYLSAQRQASAEVAPQDRIDGLAPAVALQRLADRFGGELVGAAAATTRDALFSSDEELHDVTRSDHIRFELGRVPLIAYYKDMPRRGNRADVGPGVVLTAYWRVRANVKDGPRFDIALKGWLAAPSAVTGDAAFDRTHWVTGTDLDALTPHLTASLRSYLMEDPSVVLRGRVDRIEALWPVGGLIPNSVPRFRRAAAAVAALVNDLQLGPAQPDPVDDRAGVPG